MTAWTFQSALSALGSGATAAVTTATTKPNIGDLMICSSLNSDSTTHNTAVAISDTGSGGWTVGGSILTGNGLVGSAFWWKVAASADFNGGSGITVTVTFSGGTGTNTTRVEVDIFRVVPQPYNSKITADVVGIGNLTTSATNNLINIVNTNAQSKVGDELAWGYLAVSVSNGGFLSNQFYENLALSEVSNMAQCLTANAALLAPWFVGGVNPSNSGIAGASNRWNFTWTTARGDSIVGGATFSYLPTSGLLPLLQGF